MGLKPQWPGSGHSLMLWLGADGWVEGCSTLSPVPVPQINLNESMQVVSRRVLTVAPGEPVHHVMQFDPTDSSYLYLMTSHQVRCPERHGQSPTKAPIFLASVSPALLTPQEPGSSSELGTPAHR